MTTALPLTAANDPVQFTIITNDRPLPEIYRVVSVDVWTEVNKVPKARLILSGGDDPTGLAELADAANLAPGSRLSVALGRNDVLRPVFSGTIQRLGLDIHGPTPPMLVVEAADPTAAMMLPRGTAFHQNLTDSQLIEMLLDRAHLRRTVVATSIRHPIVMQPDGNDWDLMVRLARASGMVVTVEQGVVAVAPPATGATPSLAVTLGQSMLSFQSFVDAKPASGETRGRGTVTFSGSTGIKVGGTITLAGVGRTLGGDAYVLAVHHQIAEGRWCSLVKFGPPPVVTKADRTVTALKPPTEPYRDSAAG